MKYYQGASKVLAAAGVAALVVIGTSAQGAALDLTAGGSGLQGSVLFSSSAIVNQGGTTDPFLRLQNLDTVPGETGFNTGGVLPSGDVTLSQNLQILNQQNLVALNQPPASQSTFHYVFQLNIDEPINGQTLSLDELKIYTSATAGLTSLAGATLRYDLGAGNSVLIRDGLNGAGSIDLYVYVPASLLFPGAPPQSMSSDFIYLQTSLGLTAGHLAEGGSETWSIQNCNPIPEPSTILGGMFLLGGLGWFERSRIKGLIARFARK